MGLGFSDMAWSGRQGKAVPVQNMENTMKKEVDRVRYEARRKGLRLSKLRSEEKYNLKRRTWAATPSSS
jgi:hypothetical protein